MFFEVSFYMTSELLYDKIDHLSIHSSIYPINPGENQAQSVSSRSWQSYQGERNVSTCIMIMISLKA